MLQFVCFTPFNLTLFLNFAIVLIQSINFGFLHVLFLFSSTQLAHLKVSIQNKDKFTI